MWALVNLYEHGLKICHTSEIFQFNINSFNKRAVYKVNLNDGWFEGQIIKLGDQRSDCSMVVDKEDLDETHNQNHYSSDGILSDSIDEELLSFDWMNNDISSIQIKTTNEDNWWIKKYCMLKYEKEQSDIKMKKELEYVKKQFEELKTENVIIKNLNFRLQNIISRDINILAENKKLEEWASSVEGIELEADGKIHVKPNVVIENEEFQKLMKINIPSVFLGKLALLVIGHEDMVSKSVSGKMTCKSRMQKQKVDQDKMDALRECFKYYLATGKHDSKVHLRMFRKYIARKMATEIRVKIKNDTSKRNLEYQ